MFREAASAADLVRQQLSDNDRLLGQLAARIRASAPRLIITCARGSSDHAATFAKYLFETRLGIPTLSQAPSMSSIYGRPLLHMEGQPFIIVSQSGKSPDLLASAEAARQAGALVIAFVNDTASPLADMAEVVVPLGVGVEKSVAATKSYIAALSAFAQLAGHMQPDPLLDAAIADLPAHLAEAWQQDWSAAVDGLAQVRNCYVLGRGLTLGVALEAALKFKETCGIHGEAFSIAEVAHGPMALARPDFPVLVFPPFDAAVAGLDTVAAAFAERGAPIMLAGPGSALPGHLPVKVLPVNGVLHPVTAPIVMIQSFYRMANALALRRGLDPDNPPLLRKVTETQ
jgi:glucosamine--fructose-6-phosphate aminotransferase (isomerizing)